MLKEVAGVPDKGIPLNLPNKADCVIVVPSEKGSNEGAVGEGPVQKGEPVKATKLYFRHASGFDCFRTGCCQKRGDFLPCYEAGEGASTGARAATGERAEIAKQGALERREVAKEAQNNAQKEQKKVQKQWKEQHPSVH